MGQLLTAINMNSSMLCFVKQCNCPLFTACLLLLSYLAYSSTLKMEAAFSSDTSVDFQRTVSGISKELEIFSYYFFR
jgi:hypothetical protein